jgi:hypothetical protein
MVAVVVALAWASRNSLNVDGVAYLDLADRLHAGDQGALVQGYWSPLYPLLLSGFTAVASGTPAASIQAAHLLNAVIALAGVALLWRWSRTRPGPAVAGAAFTAFLLAGARAPRLDAVTPDLLLLVLLLGASLELLRAGGHRPMVLGLWLGLAFLAKTSAWPWLVVTAVVALVANRRDAGAIRRLARTGSVTMLAVLAWLVPLSVSVGAPTFGSAAPLNACWYLLACDGRSPDSHRGGHLAYRSIELGEGRRIRIADLPSGAGTYPPWSDPAGWQRGVTSQREIRPPATALLGYWGRQASSTLAYWLPHLLVVCLGLVALTRPVTGRARSRWHGAPGFLVAAGVAGILQFVAVHAEPRLIAPFVLMAALGVIGVTLDAERSTARTGRPLVMLLVIVGFLTALSRSVLWLPDLDRVSLEAERRGGRLAATRPGGVAVGDLLPVAVLGPALPMMPDLYRRGAVVVAQLFEPPPAEVTAWPAEAQGAVARLAADAGARELWISRSTDAYAIVPLAATTGP